MPLGAAAIPVRGASVMTARGTNREPVEIVQEAPSLDDAISSYAASCLRRALPPDVSDRANLHILDTLAAIVSGSNLAAGRAGQDYVRGLHASPTASVLGTPYRAPVVDAAFANGMAAHADETDDTHEGSFVHPGCGVLPAALAAAEARRRSGRELQRAVVLGYDMAIRFAEAVGAGMTTFRSSLATHSYGPCFGAGFAAGALLGFDANEFQALLSYLAQEASGITTWPVDEAHVLKSYVFAAMPASNALRAARCVELGYPGGGPVLDQRRRNMLDALSTAPRPAALVGGLGERFAVMESEIKSHPVGYPVIAPVVAAERLVADRKLDISRVVAIRVYYDEDWYSIVGASRMPAVNLPYCLAVALLDGHVSFRATHDSARMTAPEVRAVMDKVQLLHPGPGPGKYRVRIEIDLGTEVLSSEQGGERGAENPLSHAHVATKARELLEPVLGARRSERVIEMTLALDELTDVGLLVNEMRAA